MDRETLEYGIGVPLAGADGNPSSLRVSLPATPIARREGCSPEGDQKRTVADKPYVRGSLACTRLAVLPGKTVLFRPSGPPSG